MRRSVSRTTRAETPAIEATQPEGGTSSSSSVAQALSPTTIMVAART